MNLFSNKSIVIYEPNESGEIEKIIDGEVVNEGHEEASGNNLHLLVVK